MATTTLVHWGNGQGIRLSKELISQAGLKVGDELDVQVENGGIRITPARKRYIGIVDYEKLFEGYQGPQPTEDGFASPAGRERM
ncbi:AbrB/MazE/SpoVT family DNA-binding domain-containing protein [Bifidobacterium vespertilionis]|uniref:AbrB/MazE/SpoVT family DNA-binding domain-containing protein n=1 Tax=Bifidobacterium vespertilionis TaxID=2562524 RepID=UPI001BDC493D|nr:AbrB/MazE/SpoVT family DNA-binding domain-containing protein [Bifidobacterium vespertilionis]MBT1179647.1 AbrB/MazE/SpoVT family DNA-binding domain-containing protein [Bifidobacterium vespertilionis]